MKIKFKTKTDTGDDIWVRADISEIDVEGIRYTPEVLAYLGVPEGDYHISQVWDPDTKGTVKFTKL